MNHSESVERWLGARFAALPAAQQLDALERGFNAVWTRARGTLGDVTLGAIGERVRAHAVERFPFLAATTLDRDGLRCREVHAPTASALDEAVRYVLLELLMLLGRLTAEILSPALHDELDKTPPPSSGSQRTSTQAQAEARAQAPAADRPKGKRTVAKRSKNKKSRSPRGEKK